jgi:hypothetical protein
MTRKTLEAICEALVHTSGYNDPGSEAYQARNPGGLVAFSPAHAKTEKGLRVFASVIDGLQSLIFDLNLKLSGKSRAKLKPVSSLEDLALACGLHRAVAVNWASYLRKALNTESITRKTTIEELEKL